MASAITPLANVTLASNVSTITFSSISQSYQDLIFVFSMKTASGTDYVGMRTNGLTSLYGMNMFDGTNTTKNAYATVNGSRAYFDQNYASIETNGQAAWLYIHDYSSTNRHKSAFLKSGTAYNQSTNFIRFPNNSAMTSIVFDLTGNQYGIGTNIALYGVSA